jgi:hypothetical protein
MSIDKKPIRGSKEVIWHLTCGECSYYWTYPTMQLDENINDKTFHCPLCGIKNQVTVDDSLSDL